MIVSLLLRNLEGFGVVIILNDAIQCCVVNIQIIVLRRITYTISL